MPGVVYILCLLASLASALLLARAAKGPAGRLLFWGAIFFLGMALNNILLWVDVFVGPTVDWSLAPNIVALVSVGILIYALIWEAT